MFFHDQGAAPTDGFSGGRNANTSPHAQNAFVRSDNGEIHMWGPQRSALGLEGVESQTGSKTPYRARSKTGYRE